MKENLVYTLGLDIGTNSIGWAMLRGERDAIDGILDCGVRIFEAGMEKLETGKPTSRNAERRAARMMRRQTERRARRKSKTFGILQRAGLLPEGVLQNPEPPLSDVLKQDPYALRARALDERLEPFEIGRALYHLSQRRGFLSNRKTPAKEKETDSKGRKVESHIKEFAEKMRLSGARTWGEYLSKVDPSQERRRAHYTHRDWFKQEFDAIWDSQTKHYPDLLTQSLRGNLYDSVFDQRKLKNQRFLIGKCELEPKCRRAPMALLEAQRVRYLQDANHLRIRGEDGAETRLDEARRALLVDALETAHKMTFGAIRKLLGLPKARFNFENGDRKDIRGNSTCARLAEVFGDKWASLSDSDKQRLIQDVMSVRQEKTLRAIGLARWGLDPSQADALAEVQLEDDHGSHSLRALRNLLPHLQAGLSYTEAAAKAYPDRLAGARAADRLPPLRDFGAVRNPIVERSLTELRHLVNALIERHGKPAMIRVELARDLKQSAKEREKSVKRIRENEERHERARAIIFKELGVEHPSRESRMKVLLWEECGKRCPYTDGVAISIHDLLGAHPKYDIEHIIPFSRCLDNSFNNLTLCDAGENRNRKKNRTPFEAYGGDPERYEAILRRVEAFGNKPKLERFMMRESESEELTEEFCSRQLNDTRYASRQARDFLALLYGGEWRSRIQVSAGGVTAYLRSAWGLHRILSDGPRKTRDDHRHHAVDAIAVGLSSPARARQLAEASQRSFRPERFPGMPEPWPAFLGDARRQIERILVSHRTCFRVRGQIHNDTLYGKASLRQHGAKPGEALEKTVLRKPIGSLSEPEILGDCIVDKAVREAVQTRFRAAGSDKARFKKEMEEPANHPRLVFRGGKSLPIHAARVVQSAKPQPLGEGPRQRWVSLANNHHIEFFEKTDPRGVKTWTERVVSLLEAMRRKREGLPVVGAQDERGHPLALSLAKGETVELDHDGEPLLCVVQSVSQGDSEFKRVNDARLAKYWRTGKERIRSGKDFRRKFIRKLAVTVDGKIKEGEHGPDSGHHGVGVPSADRPRAASPETRVGR